MEAAADAVLAAAPKPAQDWQASHKGGNLSRADMHSNLLQTHNTQLLAFIPVHLSHYLLSFRGTQLAVDEGWLPAQAGSQYDGWYANWCLEPSLITDIESG